MRRSKASFWIQTLRVVWISLGPFLFTALAVRDDARAQNVTPTEPFSTASSSWEGYSEFVRLVQRRLGTERIKPTFTLDYDKLRPEDALIIVRPETILDGTSLSAFLADGGRVALLDDYGQSDTFLRRFGVTRVGAPVDPERRLRNNADLAIATPVKQEIPGAAGHHHPMAAQVQAVVTNHPVVLRHPRLTSVLEIRDAHGAAADLAITGVIAKRGRLFAIGDPSVFINLMLRYPGNRHLAEGLADYLIERTERDSTEQDQPKQLDQAEGRVWIVTNQFAQVGRYGEDPSFLADLLAKMSEFHSGVEKMDESGLSPGVATLFAGLISLWALTSMVSRNLQGGELRFPSFAQAPHLAAQAGVGARASILSAQKTNPVLALLELDAALRHSAAQILGGSHFDSPQKLSQALQEKGLSEKSTGELHELLSELRVMGQSLSRPRGRKPTERTMKRVHNTWMRLIEEIEGLVRKR